MSVFCWLALGLCEGFVAGRIAGDGGSWVDMVLGAAGAVVFGLMFTSFGTGGVAGFNLFSMLVAAIGAVVVLIIHRAMLGRRSF
jgi:uncharacterized membrane protein YeaQ/YmgE (transglycosylase-associated protein family)